MGRLEPVIGTNIIVTPDGDEIRLGHTWHEVDVLKNLILTVQPKWFIEIGLHEGGLSYLLLPLCYEVDMNYIGVELSLNIVRLPVQHLYYKIAPSILVFGDCFVQNFSEQTHKILYCDGGNKPKELLYFKQFCNSDDYILTHDFWDGNRKVRDVPDENISKEVLPIDIVHMDTDPTFERLDENIFKETRIVGWRKK